MNIKILCVGKIKEKFYRDAIAEYEKRLSAAEDEISLYKEKSRKELEAANTAKRKQAEEEATRIIDLLLPEAATSIVGKARKNVIRCPKYKAVSFFLLLPGTVFAI